MMKGDHVFGEASFQSRVGSSSNRKKVGTKARHVMDIFDDSGG
jgi:hypothetical protein